MRSTDRVQRGLSGQGKSIYVAQDIWAVQNFFADLCPGSAEQEPRDDRHLKSFQESPEIE
jgi:hypothetical protein